LDDINHIFFTSPLCSDGQLRNISTTNVVITAMYFHSFVHCYYDILFDDLQFMQLVELTA